MQKRTLMCLLVLVIVAITGCIGDPNIELDVSWKGFIDHVPYIANDMKMNDSRSIEVIVENKDQSPLDGIILRIESNIPDSRITPDHNEVMELGPKGTSKIEPSIFTIETLNTPPGEYSFWVYAEYGGKTIKKEKVNIDIA